jgi:hypothetical protein
MTVLCVRNRILKRHGNVRIRVQKILVFGLGSLVNRKRHLRRSNVLMTLAAIEAYRDPIPSIVSTVWIEKRMIWFSEWSIGSKLIETMFRRKRLIRAARLRRRCDNAPMLTLAQRSWSMKTDNADKCDSAENPDEFILKHGGLTVLGFTLVLCEPHAVIA